MSKILSPNSRLSKMGSGHLYWGPFNAAGVLDSGYVDLGNAENFGFNMKPMIEKQYSNLGGVATLLDQGVAQMDAELNIEGYEFSADAMTIMFGGSIVPFTQTGATITAETLTTTLVLGGIYPLAKRNVTALTDLKIGATTLILDVPGTPGDYRFIDPVAGLVQILQNPVTVGTVVAGATVTADYTTGTIALDRVAPGTNPILDGSIIFAPNNKRGINQEPRFWHVTFSSDQGPEYIGKKYATWKAKGGVLNDWLGSAGAHGGSAAFPFCSIINQTTS